MLEKLQQLETEFEELQKNAADPAIIANQPEYIKLMRRMKEIEKAVELYRSLKQATSEITEAEEILNNEKDAEMQELAKEQLSSAKEEKEKLLFVFE